MLRNARLFLEDVEKSCARIVLYTEGRTRDQVFNDELRLDGILFNLQVIGEAVKRLPVDLRERYPEVAWREIAGLRDFVAHAYFALDQRKYPGEREGRRVVGARPLILFPPNPGNRIACT